MNIKPLSIPRSDLAIELAQSLLKQENTCEKSSKTLPEGLSVHTQKHGSVEITCVRIRSEERRVGKECRSRWSPYH